MLFAPSKFIHYLVGYFIGRQLDIIEECTLVFVTTDGHHLHRIEQSRQVEIRDTASACCVRCNQIISTLYRIAVLVVPKLYFAASFFFGSFIANLVISISASDGTDSENRFKISLM